jgi:hypothetical protein
MIIVSHDDFHFEIDCKLNPKNGLVDLTKRFHLIKSSAILSSFGVWNAIALTKYDLFALFFTYMVSMFI